MTLDEAITRYKSNAEYERTHGNLQGCLDFKQLADWLSELKEIKEQEPCYNPDEWCHDCSEYNQDKHCCPRYNGVIRKTVEEIKQPKAGHWIRVDNLFHKYKCSNCGDVIWTGENNNPYMDSPYCCKCGCCMVEPQERNKEWVNFAEDLIPIIDTSESEET